ncbi:MAG: ABC transporter permease subunit [Vicinamibacterales bacterium]
MRASTIWRAGVALLLLAAWETVARSAQTLLLPTVSDTMSALARLLMSAAFWSALWISHQALLLGFVSAALIGVPLGLAFGHWPSLGRWVRPHLQIMLVVPTAAVIPLVIMVAGLSLRARGLVVFMFAFPVIAVTAEAGMREANARLLEMARSFGATPAQMMWRVRLPAAWPAVLAGLRLGLARAFSGMVVGELVLMAAGIGGLLMKFQSDFDAASVYAVVAVVVLESVVLMRVVAVAEQRLLGWQDRPAFG